MIASRDATGDLQVVVGSARFSPSQISDALAIGADVAVTGKDVSIVGSPCFVVVLLKVPQIFVSYGAWPAEFIAGPSVASAKHDLLVKAVIANKPGAR